MSESSYVIAGHINKLAKVNIENLEKHKAEWIISLSDLDDLSESEARAINGANCLNRYSHRPGLPASSYTHSGEYALAILSAYSIYRIVKSRDLDHDYGLGIKYDYTCSATKFGLYVKHMFEKETLIIVDYLITKATTVTKKGSKTISVSNWKKALSELDELVDKIFESVRFINGKEETRISNKRKDLGSLILEAIVYGHLLANASKFTDIEFMVLPKDMTKEVIDFFNGLDSDE